MNQKSSEGFSKNAGCGICSQFLYACLCLLLSVFSWTCLYAATPTYPNRPITLVVPLAPGGMTDASARVFADFLGKTLKQSVVVLNKAGGESTIGGKFVADAKPDGYTLGFFVPGALFPEIYSTSREPPYPSDALLPISRIMAPVVSITVKGDSPWNSFKDLVKYAKENPGMKVGIQGVYTGAWLLLARISKTEGTNFVSAPFGSGAEIITALLGGHIPIGTPEYSRVRPLHEAHKLKALVVLATKRPSFAPDIPVPVELGYRQGERAFIALTGPRGLPEEIARKIDAATQMVAEDPAFRKKCDEMSMAIDYESYTTFRKSLKEEAESLQAAFKEVGIMKK